MANDDIYKSGTLCTLNELGDLYFNVESRDFIGAPCVIVKRTKAGLIQVALVENPNKTYSAPQRNVEISEAQ
jgi:hypothetical protein